MWPFSVILASMNLKQAQLVTTSINAIVYLRVHGIDGLRVVGASVMPSNTNGNINALSMMIGERAADLIAATW